MEASTGSEKARKQGHATTLLRQGKVCRLPSSAVFRSPTNSRLLSLPHIFTNKLIPLSSTQGINKLSSLPRYYTHIFLPCTEAFSISLSVSLSHTHTPTHTYLQTPENKLIPCFKHRALTSCSHYLSIIYAFCSFLSLSLTY